MGTTKRSSPQIGPKPLIKLSPNLLVAVLLILLVSVLMLFFFAQTRQQITILYILSDLVVAVVTFGVLGSTGWVQTRDWQMGGAAAVFVVVLGMLLPFVRETTGDIRGVLYVNEVPPETATIHLLEPIVRDNRRPLLEQDQGQFEFKGIRGIKNEVVFNIVLPGYKKVVRHRYEAGKLIRLEFSTVENRTEPFTFGGYIYGENDEPLSTAVRLLDDDEKQIQERDSDTDGRVGFNISFDQRVAAIQCVGHGAPIPLSPNDYHEIKTTRHFELYLKTRRIKIQ